MLYPEGADSNHIVGLRAIDGDATLYPPMFKQPLIRFQDGRSDKDVVFERQHPYVLGVKVTYKLA